MSPATRCKAQTLLAEAALRRTPPRIAVLQVLLNAHEPLNQDQITARLDRDAPNKVTVYRTLQALCAAGIVHRAFVQKRTWYFESAERCTEHQCHPHFTCTGCGRTTCLAEMRLPAVARSYKGYTIQRQRVQLEGLCPTCRERK